MTKLAGPIHRSRVLHILACAGAHCIGLLKIPFLAANTPDEPGWIFTMASTDPEEDRRLLTLTAFAMTTSDRPVVEGTLVSLSHRQALL